MSSSSAFAKPRNTKQRFAVNHANDSGDLKRCPVEVDETSNDSISPEGALQNLRFFRRSRGRIGAKFHVPPKPRAHLRSGCTLLGRKMAGAFQKVAWPDPESDKARSPSGPVRFQAACRCGRWRVFCHRWRATSPTTQSRDVTGCALPSRCR